MDANQTIRKIRRLKNIRQADLAKALGVSQSNYAKLENSKIELTIAKLFKISEILKVHPCEILFPEEYSSIAGSVEKSQGINPDIVYKEIIEAKNSLIKELKEKVEIYKELYEESVRKRK
ncbi:MAG: hypothetical protein Kow0068_01400 [Marinilabiliales bacterium]